MQHGMSNRQRHTFELTSARTWIEHEGLRAEIVAAARALANARAETKGRSAGHPRSRLPQRDCATRRSIIRPATPSCL